MGYITSDVSSFDFERLLSHEWLQTNGLGGYASSTIPSVNTRKYHGLLVAAMSPPVRRMVLLSRVEETVVRDGWPSHLAANEYPGVIHPEGHLLLRAFSHDPFPRWAYQGEGWTLEKSLWLLKGENTVCLTYTLLGGTRPVELVVTPLFALRGIHELMYQWNGRLAVEHKGANHHRVPATSRTPEVFFAHDAGALEQQPGWYFNTIYRREQERGYAGLEDLWTPGAVRMTLHPGRTANFVCSADPIDLERVLNDVRVQRLFGRHAPAASASSAGRLLAEAVATAAAADAPAADAYLPALTAAADQFVVRSARTVGDGERATTVVSRYPWSPPSVRHGLIAFPGLFLVAGRFDEARSYLLSLAELLDEGILPSEFPETGALPKYESADASLWFASAVHQYLRYTGDEATVRTVYAPLLGVIDALRRGTKLGLCADEDGLLSAGVDGTPVTWMNAKVGGWVVTPRAGKPVELNALWYNALRVVASLAERFGDAARARELGVLAGNVRISFNCRFWNESAGCCYDVLSERGNESAVRPNQVLAAGLPFPVLTNDRIARVVEVVRESLLTPYGLRTLSREHPAYCGHYDGNANSRDRAHHNGSVHPWLLGPFVTALRRASDAADGGRAEAAEVLRPCLDHVCGGGLGQLPELFDGDAPHAPGGAIASAACVGELLRAYVEHRLDVAPDRAAQPADAPSTGHAAPASPGVTNA